MFSRSPVLSLVALLLSYSPTGGLANNFLTCISSPFEAARPPATPFGPPPLQLVVYWGHFAGIAGWGVLSIGRCGWVYAARCRYSIEKRNGFFLSSSVSLCSLLGLARIAGGTRYKTGGAQPCRYGIRLGAASYSRRSAYFAHRPFSCPTVSTDNAAGTDATAHRQRLGWRRSGRHRVPVPEPVPVPVPAPVPATSPSQRVPCRSTSIPVPDAGGTRAGNSCLAAHPLLQTERLHNPGMIRAGRPGRHVSRGVWE